jgi:hypothetical protein
MTNRRKIKEVKTEYWEEIDDSGERVIRIVEEETTWFTDSESGTRHNPTVTTSVSYL